jgi:crotonobetainyl-CoA:carnitine CoA-transferase CaiB-like acyl-CoA transferase
MTLFLSGPFGTQILGDLGAEVIKVEPPDGDNTRHLPPHFIGADSAYFASVNRNKRSIVVDHRRPEGRAVIERLAATADVFIENLKPGALARYGIAPERLRAANPRLVTCSISGFGQDGPYRAKPAYDMVVQALSGGMSMTGEPGGPAVRAGVPLADLSAGLYAVIGILAALEERHRTGLGKAVDVAMLDCQVAMLCYQAAYHLASGEVPGRQGRGHASIPSYRSFTAGDGRDVVICANTDRMWRSLCEVIGRHDLRDDPGLADRKGRYQRREEIWAALDAAFLTRSAVEWVARLEGAEVPVGTVNTLDRTLSDPQVLHRGMVLPVRDEATGLSARVAGNPLKFPGSAGEAPARFPPPLGRDTEAVLREAGLSGPEIADLLALGVLRGEAVRA